MTEVPETDRMIDEIARLRAHVEQLEARVGELDQLAHLDALVNLPNRRGFMRELERLVDQAKRYGNSSAIDRKSTCLNSSHVSLSRMPSSA